MMRMRHFKTISGERPAFASDAVATVTAAITLLTAVVGLLGQIGTVFGISFSLTSKRGA